MQIQFITIKVLIQCHLGIKLIQCRALFHAGMKGSRNNPFSNDVTLITSTFQQEMYHKTKH